MPLDIGRALRPPFLRAPPTTLALASWGQAIRTFNITVPDPYFGWTPLKLHPNGELDLEFSPLLLGERILVDLQAFEVITKSRRQPLFRAAGSLRRLQDEGIIEVVKFRDAMMLMKENITKVTQQKISMPHEFQEDLLRSNELWDEIARPLSDTMGVNSEPVAHISLGLVHAMTIDGFSYTPENVKKLSNILSKPHWKRGEFSLVSEMLRPYFEHVLSHVAVMRHFGVPVVDWKDLGPLYNSVLFGQLEFVPEMQKYIPKVRDLFASVMSRFQPETVDEFLRVLRDRRVRNFRAFIAHCAQNDVPFDFTITQRLIEEFTSVRERMYSFGTKLNVAVSATGVMFGMVESSLVAAVAAAAIGVTGQEAGTRLLEKALLKETEWLLPFLDAKKPVRRWGGLGSRLRHDWEGFE